jgi:AraC-like DNA-binding protein
MAAAVELLSRPAILVRDVAQQVGYRQPSHFARTFRHRYGVSPAVFRTKHTSAEKATGRLENGLPAASVVGAERGE